jgi:hypothetical protein
MDTSFKGFVNYDISEQEKAEFEVWSATVLIDDVLAATLVDLKKLSVKFLEKEKCFAAFLFDGNGASMSAGYILSARAATPVRAMYRVLFLDELLGDNWLEHAVRSPSADRW